MGNALMKRHMEAPESNEKLCQGFLVEEYNMLHMGTRLLQVSTTVSEEKQVIHV